MLPLAVGIGGHCGHVFEIKLPHGHRRRTGYGHVVTLPRQRNPPILP
jgi:hypothetical protein